jgi:hypothetical protein
MAGLSVRHPHSNSLRLALLKGSNQRPIGGSLLALLSQSRAAYRNRERRDDCNSRNPHSEVSHYSVSRPAYLLSSLRRTRIDIDQHGSECVRTVDEAKPDRATDADVEALDLTP